MLVKNIILNRLQRRQRKIKAEQQPYKERLQHNLSSIQQAVTSLGYVASVASDEVIFHCHSIEAARELDRRIYDGSFTIQKTPLPGSGGMWEVRVSDG